MPVPTRELKRTPGQDSSWSLTAEDPRPDVPVFPGGGASPNARFQALCGLAGIKPRMDVETGH